MHAQTMYTKPSFSTPPPAKYKGLEMRPVDNTTSPQSDTLHVHFRTQFTHQMIIN